MRFLFTRLSLDVSDQLSIARALHVVGVVLWIGGVGFVTTVLIPSIRNIADPDKQLELFESLESRFSLQAKFSTLLTGVTGFYMLYLLNGWVRYEFLSFWWLHLMTFIWVVFSLILFVFEPLFLHRWFHKVAKENPKKSFLILHMMHIVLLTVSLISVIAAVAKSHGFGIF